MAKNKDKKPAEKAYDNGFRGVSPQGAAIFAPGMHPKERQLASKNATPEEPVMHSEPSVPAEVPVEEPVAVEPVEEAATSPEEE